MPTWDAKQYLRFNDERTRPCHDLAARITVTSPNRVIDLGCGPGNSTAVLAKRWPNAQVMGLDNSPEMIAAARQADPNLNWRLGDISAWAGDVDQNYDVVFSNAALQWVGDHSAVFSQLLSRVTPGGALAIQMPGNYDAPAHRIMRQIASSQAWQDRFPAGGVREWHVHDLATYYDILATAAAAVDMWETEYQHILPDPASIVEWYKGTGLRPFLNSLATDALRADFLAEYLDCIRQAYPARSNGQVLFPFRRYFLIAYRATSSLRSA